MSPLFVIKGTVSSQHTPDCLGLIGLIELKIGLRLSKSVWFVACLENRLACSRWYGLPMMTSPNGNTFPVTGLLCGEFQRSPVNSPHKGQWREALMFSLICAWTKCWVNNREAGDLRRHHAQYDVTVMQMGKPIACATESQKKPPLTKSTRTDFLSW